MYFNSAQIYPCIYQLGYLWSCPFMSCPKEKWHGCKSFPGHFICPDSVTLPWFLANTLMIHIKIAFLRHGPKACGLAGFNIVCRHTLIVSPGTRVSYFPNEIFQTISQTLCTITLVAFVLFSTVYCQMCIQIACMRRCMGTLDALVLFSSTVCA